MGTASRDRTAELLGAIPQLAVSDPGRALDFYARGLGFCRVDGAGDSGPGIVIRRDSVWLRLVTRSDVTVENSAGPNGRHACDVVLAVAGLDGLLEELLRLGVPADGCERDGDGRLNEFSVADPDGNRLSFVEWTEYQQPACVRPKSLTDREVEILRLASRGYSNKRIAETLAISWHTAARHMSNVIAKLDVHNRTEAVSIAMETGLLRQTARFRGRHSGTAGRPPANGTNGKGAPLPMPGAWREIDRGAPAATPHRR